MLVRLEGARAVSEIEALRWVEGFVRSRRALAISMRFEIDSAAWTVECTLSDLSVVATSSASLTTALCDLRAHVDP